MFEPIVETPFEYSSSQIMYEPVVEAFFECCLVLLGHVWNY